MSGSQNGSEERDTGSDTGNGDPSGGAGSNTYGKSSIDDPNKGWSEEDEKILTKWCDHAQCYTWLCYTSHTRYSNLQAAFSIPTIIFSTIIGAASFTNISSQYQMYLPILVGSVNITIGILTTILQYFKISEYNENYRICSRAWDKFARNIEVELSKKPKKRKDCVLFMKKACEDFERLMETTPNFPTDIIDLFSTTFHHHHTLYRPRILNGVVPAEFILRDECKLTFLTEKVDPKIKDKSKDIDKVNANVNVKGDAKEEEKESDLLPV
jgi:hypothetical protein